MGNGNTWLTKAQQGLLPSLLVGDESFTPCIQSLQDLKLEAFPTTKLNLSSSVDQKESSRDTAYATQSVGFHLQHSYQEDAYGYLISNEIPMLTTPKFLSYFLSTQVHQYAMAKEKFLRKTCKQKNFNQFDCPGTTLAVAMQVRDNQANQTLVCTANIGYCRILLVTKKIQEDARWTIEPLNEWHQVKNPHEQQQIFNAGGEFVYLNSPNQTEMVALPAAHNSCIVFTRSIGNIWSEGVSGYSCKPSVMTVTVDDAQEGFLLQTTAGMWLDCSQMEYLINQSDFYNNPHLWAGLLTGEVFLRSERMCNSTIVVMPIRQRPGVSISSVADGHRVYRTNQHVGNLAGRFSKIVVQEVMQNVMEAFTYQAHYRNYFLLNIRDHEFQLGWRGGEWLVHANGERVLDKRGKPKKVAHTAAEIYKILIQDLPMIEQMAQALTVLNNECGKSFFNRIGKRRSLMTQMFYEDLQNQMQLLHKKLTNQPVQDQFTKPPS